MSAGDPPAATPYLEQPDLVGQTLDGRYRVIKKLGEGGMGEVFAAEHVHIEKRFAIKLLRPEIVSNPEAVQRFRQEARSSSSIGHRNIIGIEDFGNLSDGRIYMCMELLDGAALNDLIQTPQPIERLLNILIQTGHGLAAAHAKNIVHRDMKPENIFVTIQHGEDIPKILDFGIAKVAGNDGQNNLTRTGTIFGTPFYMAPEQALGNPVDARTDIYAMGVICYEVFAGSLPFQGESFMGILTQHITTDPEPVEQRAAKAGRQLPPGLSDIVMRCMRKNPAERFATMDELVNALIGIYRGIAGAGMSTYMEAFPVHRQHAPTGGPTGAMASGGHPMPGHGGHGHPSHGHPAATPPTGMHPVPTGPSGPSSALSSQSGLYDPNASVINVPKKGKAGLVIGILALLAVAGGIVAIVVMGDKKDKGTEVAGMDPGSGSGSGSATAPDEPGSNAHGANGSGEVGSSGGPVVTNGSNDPGSAAGSNVAGSDSPWNEGSAGSAGSNGGTTVDDPPPVVDAGVVVPEGPKPVAVLLTSSRHASFEVYENGVKIQDGSGNLEVTPGVTRTLTIKARNFKDGTVVLDGKKKKVDFKLEKLPVVANPGSGTHVPKALDCRKSVVDPKDKKCQQQFCKHNPNDVACGLE